MVISKKRTISRHQFFQSLSFHLSPLKVTPSICPSFLFCPYQLAVSRLHRREYGQSQNAFTFLLSDF